MKILVLALASIFGIPAAAGADRPAPLASIRAIQALTNDQANHHLDVAFDATVTFFLGSEGTLFVQDGETAIYVSPPPRVALSPGDRVRITGTTQADFSPSVRANSIALLSRGALPHPAPATFEEIMHGGLDCRLVSVRGVIRAIDVQMRSDIRDRKAAMHPVAHVQLLTDGGYMDTLVEGDSQKSLAGLLDAKVQMTGVASFDFDGKMQPLGVRVYIPSSAYLKPLEVASQSPWSIPATRMDRILSGYHVRDLTTRVRVHGTITYYQPGSVVVLQEGPKSLWISTMTRDALKIGDIADAIGFPEAHNGRLILTRAEVKDSGIWAPVPPKHSTVRQLMASQSLNDFVSVEGQVFAAVREAAQDEYVLVEDGQLFTVIYRHSGRQLDGQENVPMKEIPVGAKVHAVGICTQEESNRFIPQRPVEILLRTPDDIGVIAAPSVVNTRNLTVVVALLLAVLFAVGARGWLVERRGRRRTAAMADIEHRRSLILERINSSQPLAAILEEIAELVTYKLEGAPCWCQIDGGAQLGVRPAGSAGLVIAQQEIPGRAGAALGKIHTALPPRSKLRPFASEALSMATALASLAIETNRLYSDLLHRSEFDQLTNVNNRFSLDRRLDELIASTRNVAGLFGLIYVDLDRFKQINDLHGHHTGDRYLEQVALRMKRQLRSFDTLARIGGDEFAALLPVVRSRADVEEIALRIEHCFREPFFCEEIELHGSASVGIAVYPLDAAGKDMLFRTADAQMYAAKDRKRKPEFAISGPQGAEASR